MLYMIEHATGLVIPLQGQAMLHSLGREQLWMIGKAGFYDIIVYVTATTSLLSMNVFLTVVGNPNPREFCCTSQKNRATVRALVRAVVRVLEKRATHV